MTTCEHLAASGLDQYFGPGKIWRCDECGFVFVTHENERGHEVKVAVQTEDCKMPQIANRIYETALKIAAAYLADCDQCPALEGIGHRDFDDCNKSETCEVCWTAYLIETATKRKGGGK